MSAYDWSDEQTEELRRAIKERLDKLTKSKVGRVSVSRSISGKDIVISDLAVIHTLQALKNWRKS